MQQIDYATLDERIEKEVPRNGPRMTIDNYKRFREKLDFTGPFRAIVAGSATGTGKSSLVETLVDKHDKYNHGYGKVIDIFGSRDNESLSWCRHDKFKNNALLIHGDSVKISCEFDTKKISELKLKDFNDYKSIISAPAFYGVLKEEWYAIDKVMRLLQKRIVWKRPWMVAVREGTSLVYSRLGIGDNQAQAKAAFVYALREFRHSGCAVAIDILRYYGLDTEVRSLGDYFFFKAHGIEGLPSGLNWLYSYYDLFQDIMQMPPWCFIGVTKKGCIFDGRFQQPYWHKQVDENLIEILNIDIDYGDKIDYDERKVQTNDFEHANIIKVRCFTGFGMSKLGKGGSFKIDGSTIILKHRSSTTIKRHIDLHNNNIVNGGICHMCRKVDSKTTMKRFA